MSGNDEVNVFCIREIKPNKQHLLYIKVYQGPLGGGGMVNLSRVIFSWFGLLYVIKISRLRLKKNNSVSRIALTSACC